MSRRSVGPILLAVAVVLVVGGAALEIWQDRDVYTISPMITLPAILAMIVGVPILSRGFARTVRQLPPTSAGWAIRLGSIVGVLLWSGALWWQLTVGLPRSGNLDLDAYSAGVILFVGVALLAQCVSLYTPGRGGPPAGTSDDIPVPATVAGRAGVSFWHRAWPTVSAATLGAVLLMTSVLAAGWLDRQAANINPLYLLGVIETGGSGAWFLLVGYFGILRSLDAGPRSLVTSSGVVGGGVITVLGILWGDWVSPHVDAVWVASVAFVLTGLGLVLLSVVGLREGRVDRPPERPEPL